MQEGAGAGQERRNLAKYDLVTVVFVVEDHWRELGDLLSSELRIHFLYLVLNPQNLRWLKW
jgi:hypothetical protein